MTRVTEVSAEMYLKHRERWKLDKYYFSLWFDRMLGAREILKKLSGKIYIIFYIIKSKGVLYKFI